MSGIRTAIVTTPALLRDLLKRLTEGRVALEVVAELPSRHSLARRLAPLRPDLVVIGLRRSEGDAVIRRLLALLPAARVIAFSSRGGAAAGFELRICRTDLGDASTADLVDFILRTAASDRRRATAGRHR